MKINFSDFRRGDCKQFNSRPELFFVLWKETNEDPCTTGCVWFMDGKCPCYKKNTKYIKPAKSKQTCLTNADLAKKLNVSKRQISKMRKNGTLKEALEEI